MKYLYLCLLLLCPAYGDAPPVRKISCRFLCMQGAETPFTLLNVAAKGEEAVCTLPITSLSDAVVCTASGNALEFLTPADRKPAARVTVAPDVKAAILIFAAAAKAPDVLSWHVFVIDDSPANFPDGGAFVANFHNQDIRFLIGENKIQLHTAEVHGFARPTQRDPFNMAPVIFQFQQDSIWRTASESALRFVPGMRYLILAHLDPASGRPRISTYQDLRPAPVPAAARTPDRARVPDVRK